eukprot:gene20785-biopygen20625
MEPCRLARQAFLAWQGTSTSYSTGLASKPSSQHVYNGKQAGQARQAASPGVTGHWRGYGAGVARAIG